jgi:iron complex outermembrane receptor protein
MKHLFTPFLPLFSFNSRSSTVALALLLTILLCSPVFAAEERTEIESESTAESELPEIVVTATRYEEKVQKIPANVSVITRDEIKNSTAQNIPELLRMQPGVKVNDINGGRRSYTIDLRGFGESASSNTLVLVDGRRINQADLSGVDWVQIPLDRVERIEIIRGGRGSVFYGDNASGGVINIITREGDQFRAGAEYARGSYDTNKVNAYVSGMKNNLSFLLSGSYLGTEGYRDNSDQVARDIGLNMDYYIGSIARINFSTGYHEDEAGLPGALFEDELKDDRKQTNFSDDFAEIADYYYKLRPEIYFWDDSMFRIDASFRERDTTSFASFSGGNFTGDTEIKTVAVSPLILFKNSFGNVQNSLTVGFDYEKVEEDILNSSVFFGSPSVGEFDLDKEGHGYYIYDDLAPVKNLSLSLGYRYDKADYDFDSKIKEPPGVQTSPASTSLDAEAYTAGINYAFNGKSYIYFSYNHSFRYPLLDEFFSFFMNTIEEDLKQQRSDGYEAGVRYYFTDIIYSHVNFFRIDTEDEIFYNLISFANENLDGETRRQGVEVSFNAGLNEWWSLNGSYTYLDGEITSGQFKDNEIPDAPEHKATAGTVLSKSGFTFALDGIYVGDRVFISDFANDFSDQDEYLVFNTKFMYKWKVLTAFLDINNIFDNEYSEYGVIGFNSATFQNEEAFYPSQKRNFLFGISVDI